MIECKDLTFKYGDKIIFENFAHTFKNNSITAILGPSGRGKTTLLRCIAGLNQKYQGNVLYDNKKITKPNKEIFMMHQHYSNFPWKTCYENVMFPIKLNRVKDDLIDLKVYQLLDKVGLKDCYTKYPSELSGGMNQRLALARTIMANPKVILMDEPMSALDINTRTDLQNLLLEWHKNTKNIIIMITHDINEAKKMSDEIINF